MDENAQDENADVDRMFQEGSESVNRRPSQQTLVPSETAKASRRTSAASANDDSLTESNGNGAANVGSKGAPRAMV